MAEFNNWEERLAKRIRDIDMTLREKEMYVLMYTEIGYPRPYYVRWQEEANMLFAAAVTLAARKKTAEARKVATAAAAARKAG